MKTREGLDQKTLAAQTGLSPTTVGKLYRGHFDRIDTHTVQTLCKYFKLRTISDLIDIEWEISDFDVSEPEIPLIEIKKDEPLPAQELKEADVIPDVTASDIDW